MIVDSNHNGATSLFWLGLVRILGEIEEKMGDEHIYEYARPNNCSLEEVE